MRRAGRAALLCCWLVAGIWLATPGAGAAQVVAVTGARVHTLSGPAIPEATVLVRDGRVSEVGAAVQVPEGSLRLEADGLEVYPGFFDPLSRLGLSEIGSVAATQDTTELGIFRPQLRARAAFYPASEHLPVVRANGITHAGAAPASEHGWGFPGQVSVLSLDGWTVEEMLVEDGAAMVLDWPEVETRSFDREQQRFVDKPFAEALTEYEERVDQIREWIEAARRAEGRRSAGGDDGDGRVLALIPVVRGEQPLVVLADRARQIRHALDLAKRESLTIVLAGARESWKVKDLLAEAGVGVILGPTQSLPVSEDDPYDRLYSLPMELRAQGIPIAFSTFGAAGVVSLPYEAGQAVAFGLPWEEAIRALTLAPAEMLGVGDRLGTIESGKIANLIVTDGDPLEIRTHVLHVLIAGRPVDLANRHSRLWEKYRSRPVP